MYYNLVIQVKFSLVCLSLTQIKPPQQHSSAELGKFGTNKSGSFCMKEPLLLLK